MKTFLLLFVTSALIAIQLTTASPVQVVQAFNDGADKEIVATLPKVNELNVGRQQTPQQVAPVAVEEDDDDDDDDDDDLDIPLDDDDDDDDDEEGDDDDDDDDDYLERFFDDILGEDDDDDDDDDLSPSTGIVQAVPQTQQTQAVAANVGDETLAEYPVEDEVSNNAVEVDSIQDGVDIVGADSALKDQTAEGPIASVQPQASNQQVSAAAAADDDDDDDDDDDEDVLEEALDDDDDDDEDDEDDDEDDDLIGEDVISARALGRKGRKARATPALNSTEETEKSITPPQIVSSTEILTSTPMAEAAAKNDESAATTISSIPVPDALVYRYNRYIDNIFERISAILKRSYDPVNVRLSTSITQKSSVKKQPGQKKKKKRNHELGLSNNEDVNEGKARTDCVETDQSNECSVAAKSNTQKAVPATVATATTKQKIGQPVVTKTSTVRRKVSSAAVKQKSPLKADTTKPQQQVINRARGTLHGLSTIKRHGNVRVTPTPEYLSVRSDFVLGPLVLKVEKSFGRGAKRETKRATATTTQMVGRINLRIVDDRATLHSIKVQQPKQVKVDSADNHDRTRKFVWQKSSHIAQVVSSKLASVAQDFLQQPPPSVEA